MLFPHRRRRPQRQGLLGGQSPPQRPPRPPPRRPRRARENRPRARPLPAPRVLRPPPRTRHGRRGTPLSRTTGPGASIPQAIRARIATIFATSPPKEPLLLGRHW